MVWWSGSVSISKETGIMSLAEKARDKDEDDESIAPERKTYHERIIKGIEGRSPRLASLLCDIRIEALLLFLVLLAVYINLVVRDFHFSSDSMYYGSLLKNWFDGKEVDNRAIFNPAHPLTTPLAIMFSFLMLPIIGPDYLLSFAILNAVLGSMTVAIFYIFCSRVVGNRFYSLICALGLAFSFAFWENCVMAEDRILGFLVSTLYLMILFAYVGELNTIKRFDGLKSWHKAFITGIAMGLTLAAHLFFALLFFASLIIIWRYKTLSFFKSKEFLLFLAGTFLVVAIVFSMVAYLLEVENIGEFIGLFTQVHTPESEYFVFSNQENPSLVIPFREVAGGAFTTFLMFISNDSAYYITIICLGALIFFIIAVILISARNKKIVRSVYIIIAIWFVQGFFFGGSDRNAWVYLLVPVWLSVGIGMDTIRRQGITVPVVKFKLPRKMGGFITPLTLIIVATLFVNNGIFFANAHFNRDAKEEFVDFSKSNIDEGNSIMIADESLVFYFGYYSEIEVVNVRDVVHDPEVSNHINSSFENGSAVYVVEYWFRDSYIKKGTIKFAQTYEDRLGDHRDDVAAFNSMYEYQTAYIHDLSDIYQITDLNLSR
jgi:hypothetical protein